MMPYSHEFIDVTGYGIFKYVNIYEKYEKTKYDWVDLKSEKPSIAGLK